MSSSDNTLPAEAHRRDKRLATLATLRIALPAMAGVLVVACLAEVTLRNLISPPARGAQAETPKMLGPRFAGTSRDGRSYAITGRDGVRDQKVEGRILISAPVLTMRTGTKTTTMTAKTGAYDQAANTLLLTGDVHGDDGSGSRFAAQQALVDTRTGAVSGQKGLKAESASGVVESDSYTVLDEGDRMIFKGGVRGRLTPER
jgi:lipopolysaccharide export system protein LptC